MIFINLELLKLNHAYLFAVGLYSSKFILNGKEE